MFEVGIWLGSVSGGSHDDAKDPLGQNVAPTGWVSRIYSHPDALPPTSSNAGFVCAGEAKALPALKNLLFLVLPLVRSRQQLRQQHEHPSNRRRWGCYKNSSRDQYNRGLLFYLSIELSCNEARSNRLQH